MHRLLVVEDEPDIMELLDNFLSDAGYAVTTAGDGVEALARFHEQSYDLVLLDLLLPKIDGYAVCEVIRQESSVPIVMLTALDSEENQLRGFDLHIDDYITKPFSMQILLRKLAAVLRRSGRDAPGHLLHYRALTLDPDGFHASIKGRALDLTQREFALLHELLMHKGKVLTRQNLLNRVWSYDFYGDTRVVDTHIKNLRKKLGVDYIETIRGVGYRIDREIPEQPDR